MMSKLLSLSFILLSYFSFSQCDDPISISAPTVTNASCQSNGEINITNVLPAPVGADYYQYSLFNNSTNSETYTWQDASLFSNLSAGSYEIRVRRRCFSSPSVSAGYITRNATITNTEVAASFTSVSVLRNDKCNNGEVSAIALGSGPLEYALVPTLTEAEPVVTYVSPRQPTSRFSGLSAGNYFMRVYNACGNASTISFTIDPELSITRVDSLAGYFIPISCDSVSFSFRVANYFKNTTNFPNDVLTKAWIVWPSGTIDSLNVSNQSNANLLTPRTVTLTRKAHVSEIDPAYNPALFWPDNLSNPIYTITFGYKDVCGVIYTNTYTYTKTTTTAIYAAPIASNVDSDCDNLAYRFAIRHTGGGGTTTTQGFSAYHGFEYSLDGGAIWQNATSSNTSSTSTGSSYTNIMIFPRGVSQNIQIRYCGKVLTSTFTPTATAVLSTTLPIDLISCLNKGRIRIRNYNAEGPIVGIRVLSKPASEITLPSYFEVNLSASTYTDPAEFSNLEPGFYEIQILDTIGAPCQLRKKITVEVKPFTFDFNFNVTCNKNLEINNIVPLGTTSGFRVMIFNSLNVKVYGGTSGVSINNITNILNIPGATISSFPDGTYTIRVAKAIPTDPNYNCLYIEKTWVKSSNNNLNLQNSVFVSGCEDGFAALGASASGGVAPYEYTLLDGSNSVVAPSSPGANTYNNLDGSEVYRLNVLDSCGSSVNRMISSNSQIQIGAPGYNTMPCVNNDVVLTLPQFTGVTYSWMKDNVLIPSATTNSFPLPNLQLSDSGEYQSKITIGGCEVTGALYINPLDCGGPLAVKLVSFNAFCDNDGSTVLTWKTASELNSKDFILQKSSDLLSWQTVEILSAKGNSNILNSYSSMDRSPFDEVNYYQLIQRDFDGKEHKFDPISNSCENDEFIEMKVYPNPTHGIFNIDYQSAKKGMLELQIEDINGRIISLQKHQLEIGKNKLFISENLVKGMYIVVVKVNGDNPKTQRLVVN